MIGYMGEKATRKNVQAFIKCPVIFSYLLYRGYILGNGLCPFDLQTRT